MFYRITARTVILFFCISWFLGTNSISLAQDLVLAAYDRDTDLYSRERRQEEVIQAINRPPNTQGLTGLIETNSAFTRQRGTLALGAAVLIEDSKTPDYSMIQVPVTLTYGITETLEAGLKIKYLNYAKSTESGLGDTDLAIKWRFNSHSATFPELAVGLVGTIPTASSSSGLNDVTDWGLKVLALASSEAKISTNSFLGLYLEMQAVFIDGFSSGHTTVTQDRYVVLNAGVLLPISSSNRLQAMLELNDSLGKEAGGGDQLAITPALRYVTKAMSITAGAQFLRKEKAGFEDTIRWVGTASYNF